MTNGNSNSSASSPQDNDGDSSPASGGQVAKPGTIPQQEVDFLRAAWQQDPTDLGIGLYNPASGEIHVKSMDSLQGAGHHGLAVDLGISDRSDWRGFVVASNRVTENISHFNQPDRTVSGHPMRMRDEYFQQVLAALRNAGLIS